MQTRFSSTSAAIDIGSNTIHIVVARCAPMTLDILADEVELVRIGESVTATGEISSEKRDVAITTLRNYKAIAEQYNASPIFVVATEAIRQAGNSGEFIKAVRQELGLEVQLIAGTVEATLTFLGATYERNSELAQGRDKPVPTAQGRNKSAPTAQGRNKSAPTVGVMDLGGGSTELITAKHGQITWRTSVSIGSGWLHDRYLPSDPPTREELYPASTFLTTYFEGMQCKHIPPSLIVTGGSANSLLALARNAFQLAQNEQRLTREDIVRCEGILQALSAGEIAQRYQQPIGRTRILLAGALIIRAMMERLQLSEIFVSPHGIREGVLLAYTRYGEQWLQLVDASNESRAESVAAQSAKKDKLQETFAQSGRRLLLDRTEKLLEWRNDVLRHDDIEAVHKMRVASRRLRATLDAYEAICAPQPFKEVYKLTKKVADMLGNARDTDVMIQNLQVQVQTSSAEEQVGTQWLINRLREYREKHQRALETFFKKFDEHAFRQKIDACLAREEVYNGKG